MPLTGEVWPKNWGRCFCQRRDTIYQISYYLGWVILSTPPVTFLPHGKSGFPNGLVIMDKLCRAKSPHATWNHLNTKHGIALSIHRGSAVFTANPSFCARCARQLGRTSASLGPSRAMNWLAVWAYITTPANTVICC